MRNSPAASPSSRLRSPALLDSIGDAAAARGLFDSRSEEAEEHRHLLRLTSAAFDLLVERADPAWPLPPGWMSPTRKFPSDSPEAISTTMPVSRAHRERLTIGTVAASGCGST